VGTGQTTSQSFLLANHSEGGFFKQHSMMSWKFQTMLDMQERDGLLQALEGAKASIMIHPLVVCFVDRLFVHVFPWYCRE
jgi:hypothetical protein